MRIAVGCVLLALVAGAVLWASLSPPRTLTSALVEPEAADAVTDSGQAPAALPAAPSLTEAAKPGAGNTDCERDNSAHRTWAYFEGDAPWWREVRAAEWGARAYGGGERDYGRGGYVRDGFSGYMR
jgi:hypothetical protein